MKPLHASTVKSFARCPEAFRLTEMEGHRQRQNSRTAFGSVMHAALEVLERSKNLEQALDTFSWYWNPAHIEAICDPIEDWLARDSYSNMRTKGIAALRNYADARPWEEVEILSLEHAFTVPIEGTVDPETGGPLMLAGSVDRLCAGFVRGEPVVKIDDYKTGKRPPFLRHAVQFTLYALASEHPLFWVGNPEHHVDGFGQKRGQQLFERFANRRRHATWIDVMKGEFVDAGFRVEQDYARARYALQQVASSIHAGIFPLILEGEHCTFCGVRSQCAGVGVVEGMK